GGDSLALHWKRPRTKHPPLVVLADISGSMHRYTRMLLHFLHAVTHDHDRVETFLFGTQLTRISRELKHRDIDQAINKVTQKAADWAGGTRIGPCLREFNFRWARRVLGQNAVVLLISDGLDRDESGVLEGEMARLAGTCHRLIWLNPLLRYAGFEAKPAGVRAMLPYVDEFLPVHNLDSIAQLAEVFSTRNSRPSAWQRGL
ncbi:MAG: VWA domain-containing protein, partial [Betaproteobacteria bacterium]|nr:VWA domain-containing protein [Betaproteobacteria bacterium]